MSSMLEQAIVDANALKEAALKNAEQALVDKYSYQIKEAVDHILEQDELDDLGDEDLGIDLDVGGESTGEESSLASGIPLAGIDGEKLCPCPDDEEEIEIDFDELERQMSDPGALEHGAMDREGFADDELEDDLALQEALEEDEELEEALCEECDEMDEELDLDEDNLENLAEELHVDLEVVPTGNQGANKAELQDAYDIALARASEDEMKEEIEELKDQVEKLEEKNKNLGTSRKALQVENKKLKTFLTKFQSKLDEVHLVNAKLLYKNRVLDSSSLNERQKQTLAEAINKADSVENAKTIYETLKSTVGSRTKKESLPQSLREAITRRSSMRPRKTEGEASDPKMLRMQKLAGIK